ncbi:helix-turn-helix domain-containing protein [Pseudoxanthomonas winnipegensis]|jgi:AraC family transcriptional activator of pobA|uniref:Helix-turn-helix domain-containing protein n=2 Tax=Pseudoxanthomonas winnipegensis TaxID=2480810 RepID=A0ABY1WJQ7_9GAMM|nr:helix-turn-helix domain-containing protein [Pseudoxanthomonas winnipegensis]TAA22867.1 helix-turn-helix domain-containing protein [Pseudoxanthomonas winnipegensis]TAH73279.1 helix-turn-helix domain-containing protein [Pseudoxanthomonas winnipegensis]
MHFSQMAEKTARPAVVPAFGLYGERGGSAPTDALHWESIPARSRLHDWHIRPHRHHDLSQLLYVQRGPAGVQIDGEVRRIARATVVWMPPLHVHGFEFHARIRGHIVTLSPALLAHWTAQWPELATALARPACLEVGHDRPQLDACFAAIAGEHAHGREGRGAMLHALAGQLLVWAARRCLHQRQALPDAEQARGAAHVRAFLSLLDQHYREHWPLQRYAEQLGVSAGHLGLLCRQFADATPLELVQRRVMLEARRSLVYTAMSVQQIAAWLGFADAAYFSRYFSRNAGCSPNAFRRARQGTSAAS